MFNELKKTHNAAIDACLEMLLTSVINAVQYTQFTDNTYKQAQQEKEMLIEEVQRIFEEARLQ